jgi:hypothetical protein
MSHITLQSDHRRPLHPLCAVLCIHITILYIYLITFYCALYFFPFDMCGV